VTASDNSPGFRSGFRCARPAMLVVAVLLLPFVNTPFTIDDPIYLREAQHILTDPLHPQAFDIVWSTDFDLRASQILPGGIAAPWLLVPTALSGFAEWAGHLTELLFLLVAILVTALTALRFGLDSGQARIAAFLIATCPAVLPMAATVMPDIAAMLFAILGMERIIAWRDYRKWHQALAATCWLALAALTRSHTILLLAPALVLLLDGITREEIRESFRRFPARFLPVMLVPAIFAIVSWVTADPESEGTNILTTMLALPGGLHLVLRNGLAFLAHWVLVVPLTIPWLVLRFRRNPLSRMLALLFGAWALSFQAGWVAFPAVATVFVFFDILQDAIRRRDRVQFALWLWLLLAIPIVIYIQLPSKYLLPSVPAAAILITRLTRETRPESMRWLLPAVAATGAVLALFILLGVRDLANIQNRAVSDLILPRVLNGDRVWFAGHWGYQWYAELAQATPVTFKPPLPRPGDLIVVSAIDSTRVVRDWTARRVLQSISYPSALPGRVMDMAAGAGFFSSAYGYLPWVWGMGDASRFEVWQAE
jgi:hypothetical protein